MVRQLFSAYRFEQRLISHRSFRNLATTLIVFMVAVIGTVASNVLGEIGSRLLIRIPEFIAIVAALFTWAYFALSHTGTQRRSRLWIASAMLAFLVGLAFWTTTQIVLDETLFIKTVASGAFLLAALLALPGVILRSYGINEPRTNRDRMLAALDLLIMACSMVLFVLITLGGALRRSWEYTVPSVIWVGVQPLTYLVLIAAIIVLARFRTEARDLPMLFLALGTLAYLLSSTAFLHTADYRSAYIPALLEAAFLATPIFFFLAGVAPESSDGRRILRPQPTSREVILLAVPYLPLIASIVFAALTLAAGEPMTNAQEATFLTLMALVIVRQLFTLTENLRLLRNAEHEAMHDPLTGLANRTLFLSELERALENRTTRIMLVFCDLDDFKEINDSCGHIAGDIVLTQTAQRLKRCVRAEDTVARLGGDEFAVLMRNPGDPLPNIEERLLEALQEPHLIRATPHMVSASVGVTTLPPDATIRDTDELMHLADTAMYTAKRRGKNNLAHIPKRRQEPAS